MIIDASGIRKKGNCIINDLVFDYKMKRNYSGEHNKAGVIPAAGFAFAFKKSCYGGLYSYEAMGHAAATGDFVNALVFGLLPVMQGLTISDIRMLNTFIKAKMSQ